MTTLKQRFAELARLKPEISQADLARATGAKPPSVNAWFTGETKSMKAFTAARAAAVYGVDANWLATGEGEMTPSITTARVKISAGSGQAYPLGPLSSPTPETLGNDKFEKNGDKLISVGPVTRGRRVPVVGMARLGDNGFYEEVSSVTGAGDGMVEAYSDDPDAYALRARGDSMFPAIRDGWFVVVEPGSQPAPGDYVLIKLKTGQKMIKELIMQRPDGITVVSVNGDLRRTIEAEEIDPHFGIQSVAAIVSPKKWRPE